VAFKGGGGGPKRKPKVRPKKKPTLAQGLKREARKPAVKPKALPKSFKTDAASGGHKKKKPAKPKRLFKKPNRAAAGRTEVASPSAKHAARKRTRLPEVSQASAGSAAADIVRRIDPPKKNAAIDILEETTRPLHAVAEATRVNVKRVKQGKLPGAPGPTFRAAVRGARNQKRTVFSDVLKEAGVKNKAVRAGAGFALDFAADPTSYFSIGATAPAKTAAKVAAKQTAKKVAKTQARAATKVVPRKGESDLAASIRVGAEKRQAAERLAKRKARRVEATDRGQNKGITVGTRHHRTSGRASAAVLRVSGASALAKKVRGTDLVQDVGKVARPDFRPKGVDADDFKRIRAAEAEKRASITSKEREVEDLARAYRKKFGEKQYGQIIDAIESGNLQALRGGRTGKVANIADEPELYQGALRLRSHFRNLDRLDRQAGIRAGSRKNYVARVRRQDVEYEHAPAARPGRPARGGSSAHRRTIDKRMKELREERPDLFTEDIPTILGRRSPETIKGVADVAVLRELASTGRRLTPQSAIKMGDGESVYHVPAKSSVPRKLERDGKIDVKEMEKALEGRGQPGQYVILNDELADRVLKGRQKPETSGARRRYRKRHGQLKTALTVPMPSYHARNLYGDTSNASYFLNARELGSALAASGKAAKVKRGMRKRARLLDPKAAHAPVSDATIKIGKERVPVERLLDEAAKHGAVNQGFTRELREMVGENTDKASRLRNLGESRENLVRLASYIGARRQGLNPREAAERVRTAHFDYADLTSAERGIRDVIPFYTFAARNTPLQAKTLVTRPGKIARYEKVIEEGARAAGLPDDWQSNLKDYEKLGVPIPAFGLKSGGLKTMLLPGLPLTDLNRLSADPREQALLVAQMVTPIKSFLEIPANYSLFFRDKIDQGRKVNAPGWLARTAEALDPAIAKELGVEKVYDKAAGKKVWKYKAKWDYLLRQLPETSVLFNLTTEGKNRRGQGTTEKLVSLTGVRPQPYDPLDSKLNKQYERRTAINNRLKALSKQNVNKDHPTAEYKRLRAKLKVTETEIFKLASEKKKRGDAVSVPKKPAGKVKKKKGDLTPEEEFKQFLQQQQKPQPTPEDEFRQFLKSGG
jgi:hypothetical protein